jgi:hypothetical protein
MAQVLQLVGALLILSGFAGSQFRLLDPRSMSYLLVNAVGSAILAALGYYERQWGFFLLEFVWAIVSIWGIATKLLRRQPAGSR